MSRPPTVSRVVPRSLRSRIPLVLTLAALGGFTVMAAAGWLLVLEAEDASKQKEVERLSVQQHRYSSA